MNTRNIVRKLILSLLVLVCTTPPSIAQNIMYKTEGERVLREALNWVPDNLLNGGLLIDRYPEFTPIRDYDGGQSGQTLELIEWWSIYSSIYCAQRIEAKFRHPDEEQKRIYLRDIRDIFEDEKYAASLSMIHVDYSTIADDSTDMQNYSFDGVTIQHKGNDFANAINDHYCFAASISYNGPTDGELNLRIESENFFTNRHDSVVGIDVNLNNGQQLFTNLNFGSEILLVNLADSNSVEVALHLQNGDVKYCTTSLDLIGYGDEKVTKAYSPDDTHTFHDFQYGLEYKVGVWYGCYSHGKITKPFIALSGFAPEFLFGFAGWEWGDYNPVTLESGLYDNYNNAYLLDELRAKGYDIIIVQSKKGMIETDGLSYIVEDAIRWVNTWNPEGHENVVMGASQGAIAVRMALARMEEDYLNGTGPYHRTKLYISWEGEHRGVNVPIGSQAAVTRLKDKFWVAGFWENNMNHWFNSVSMKEFVIYNDANTFFAINATPPSNPSGVPQPAALAEYYNLQSQLHSYNHNFTEVSGYPSFVRRVGISNGSSTKNTFYLPEELAQFTRVGGTGSILQKHIIGTYDSYHNNGDKVIYEDQFRESLFQWTINDETFYHSGTFSSLVDKKDRIPGSVFAFGPFGNGIHRFTCEQIGNSTTYLSVSVCSDRIQDFVPTYSSLDISPTSTYFSTADFNAINAGLMYSDYPNIANGAFGYPHIGLGSSSLNYTPFDAIYADEANDHHILNSDGDLKNFILWGEIQPDHLTLQNRNVGEHLTTYSAFFEAERNIQMGENVTVKEPVGKFVITTGTSSVIRAGDAIYLQPGTSIELGSSTLIHIGYIGCTKFNNQGNKRITDAHRDSENILKMDSDASSDLRGESVKLIPNPTSGQVTLTSDNKESITNIQIFDIQGKVVWTGEMNSGKINVDLTNETNGIYIVRLTNEKEVITQRLIKQ